MFYIFSKIIAFITEPLFWISALFILAFLLKNRRGKQRCFWGALILLFLLGNGAVITWAEQQWVKSYINHADTDKVYEYALIQGGFGTFNPVLGKPQLNPSAERLVEPVRLYNTGKIKKLFITGDGSFSDKKYPESKKLFLDYMAQLGVQPADIILDSEAKNTRHSAMRTKELLGNNFEAGESLLVTCAVHMPRTMKCYQKEGMKPVSWPTSVPVPYKLSITSFGISSKNLDRWQVLFHEWIGLVAYKIMGYI